VDGGFKSGVDVIMAAAMGADEFGFGSLAMIATGCVMARICHTNNCPVGVASQVRGKSFSLCLPMHASKCSCPGVGLCFQAHQVVVLQREEMRARFPGVPGDLVNYFLYVAEEVHIAFLANIAVG